MKKTLPLLIFAIVALLTFCLIGCGDANSDESIHYYQLEKLAKKSHADIHKTLEDDGLVYTEKYPYISRCWLSKEDVIAGIFDDVAVDLEADTKWANSGFVPESEVDDESYNLEVINISLITDKPDKSIYNSESSASNIADAIMNKCELSNQMNSKYWENEGYRYFTRYGTCRMGDKDGMWIIGLVDAIDADAKLQKADIMITCSPTLMELYEKNVK